MHWITILGGILIIIGTAIEYFTNSRDDEKFYDRIPKCLVRYHYLFIIIGMVFALLGNFLDNIQSGDKIEELKSSNKELLSSNEKLLSSNTELSDKMDNYKNDIQNKEETIRNLQLEINKSKQGITHQYEYNGAERKSSGPGKVELIFGGEYTQIFNKMMKMKNEKRIKELTKLCEELKKEKTEWLTPYLFLGKIYANKNQKDKAIENLKHVISNAPDGHPEYSKAKGILESIK